MEKSLERVIFEGRKGAWGGVDVKDSGGRSLAPYGPLRGRLPPEGEEPSGSRGSAPSGGGQAAKPPGGGKWV